MPNIALLLKSEISRVARKEIRSEIALLKKAVSTQRTEIAALKRRALELEQGLRRLLKTPRKASAEQPVDAAPQRKMRFSAKGLATQRKRLDLSAAECGLLVGASNQSIYKWEDGTAHPRAKHLPGIAALRLLGKKEATARLAALREAT